LSGGGGRWSSGGLGDRRSDLRFKPFDFGLGHTLARLVFVDPGAIVCVVFALDVLKTGLECRFAPFVISVPYIEPSTRCATPMHRLGAVPACSPSMP